MSKISVVLMGTPIVERDNLAVHFSYRKMAGLFYYLCVKKKLTREEAMSIFWADSDEKSARKNLRDVIYKIKQLLGEEVIHTVGNAMIELNREWVSVDVDQINSERIVECYTGEFLHFFFIKNCNEFEAWCSDVQIYYKDLYLSKLYDHLCSITAQKDILKVSKHANILIQNDIYDERLYREIMRIYSESGYYNLAIKLYYELKELLHQDLEEDPEKETQDIFDKILGIKETQSNRHGSLNYFFGRYEELFQVSSCLNQFLTASSPSIVVVGEAGVGKTAFLKKAVEQIDPNKTVLLQYVCHYAEKDFYLKSWYNLLRKMEVVLADLPNQNTGQSNAVSDHSKGFLEVGSDRAVDFNALAISDALTRLTEQKKVILVIDDVQWLDNASLKLLNTFLLRLGGEKLLVIAAYREDYQEALASFVITLEKENLLNRMYLNRFSFEDVAQIVEDLIPAYKEDTRLIRKIYHDTEGNSLFLLELIKIIEKKGYTNLLSTKAVNIIKSRFMDLTDSEQEVLNALSFFPNKANIADLKIFYPMMELEIFEVLEKLMDKKIVRERISEGDAFYSFDHQRIQEYVRDRQSIGKRKAIHEKIARHYEAEYKETGNKNLYARMSYHFGEYGNVYKTCYYKVAYLNDYYYSHHEIYPHIYAHMQKEVKSSDQESSVDLEELAKEIEALADDSKEYATLKMQLYFVMGRYCFYTGNYQEGVEKINESTRIAIEQEDYLYVCNNYKQKIYYGIQISDLEMMKKYLDLCEQIIEKSPDCAQEKAAILRLKGLYLIETQQYDLAQEELIKTISLLTSKQKKGNNGDSIDVAVCYSYLGRSYLLQEKYEIAYEYLLKAIALCDQRYVTNAVGVFYSDAAQTLYEMARYSEALSYIERANYYFANTHALWGRAKAQMYTALIELKLNNLEAAQESFESAKETSEKLGNPKMTEVLEKVKLELETYLR